MLFLINYHSFPPKNHAKLIKKQRTRIHLLKLSETREGFTPITSTTPTHRTIVFLLHRVTSRRWREGRERHSVVASHVHPVAGGTLEGFTTVLKGACYPSLYC